VQEAEVILVHLDIVLLFKLIVVLLLYFGIVCLGECTPHFRWSFTLILRVVRVIISAPGGVFTVSSVRLLIVSLLLEIIRFR
jgi:hypothetical protein